MKSRTHWAVFSVLMALSTGLTCNATVSGLGTAGGSFEPNKGSLSLPDNGAAASLDLTNAPKYAEADMGHEIWEGTKSTAERTGDTIETAGKKTGRTLEHAGERTGRTLERVGEKTERSTKHVYHQTGRTVKHVYHRTKGSLETVGEKITSTVEPRHRHRPHVAMRKTSLEPVGERVTTETTVTTTRIVPQTQPESVGERTLIERYRNPESPLAHPTWENDYANPYR